MASVNKVILIGNLGEDPTVRYTQNGDAVANLRIATNETWKDKNGDKQERTEWHTLVFFGRSAETVGEYLKKGNSIYVEGRLQTRKWTDKEGADRYSTEVVVDRFQFVDKKRDDDGGEKSSRAAAPNRDDADDWEDDIPA